MSIAEPQSRRRERVPDRHIVRTHRRLRQEFGDLSIVDGLPSMTLILNESRQAVYASPALLEFVGASRVLEVLGRRPGEILGCTRSEEGGDGCGTAAFCRFCGAREAIVATLEGAPAEEECRILRRLDGREEALELRVSTRPLKLDSEPLTLFSISDASDQNRRRILDWVFHHDLLNTAGALRSLASILNRTDLDEGERHDVHGMLTDSVERLIAEVETQRVLSRAEASDLPVQADEVDVAAEVEARAHAQEARAELEGRGVRIECEGPTALLRTDPSLLGRVVDNLVRNAVEASAPQTIVRVRTRQIGSDVEVLVTNPVVMPAEVQASIFRRSFSTKEAGRGLGTWSVKLLTEGALGGQVGFTSEPTSGTTFRVRLPPLP